MCNYHRISILQTGVNVIELIKKRVTIDKPCFFANFQQLSLCKSFFMPLIYRFESTF